jgi:prepilin-type N-terminal cleavage/methylation domain-containing protein
MRLRIRNNRRAFTLVELLVVIAIIGVLIGLLIPAVQKARDAASRLECQNNLHQLAVGLHTYHDTYKTFPQNHRPASASAGTVRERWLTHILPFIDQEPLANRYDETTNWDSAINLPLTQTPLNILRCPAAPNPNRVDTNPAQATSGWGAANFTAVSVAVTDYAGVYGVHPAFYAANPTITNNGNPNGWLTNNLNPADPFPTKITDLTDGSSNTLLLVESAGQPYLFQGRVQQGFDLTTHGTNGGGWARPASDIWIIGFADKAGTIPGGPYTVNAANGLDAGGVYPLAAVPAGNPLGTYGSGQIYGFHPAGANSVLADGSIKFLPTNISPAVIAALATRANNDIVPGF